VPVRAVASFGNKGGTSAVSDSVLASNGKAWSCATAAGGDSGSVEPLTGKWSVRLGFEKDFPT
jgi:hypothetical protein